ncbi:hypothetical protein AX14_000904 [Amanita brunnescens Koide BX004]|nr:hypothetical protein AX14_000904 [Amanita brunnescens Koide BX004]
MPAQGTNPPTGRTSGSRPSWMPAGTVIDSKSPAPHNHIVNLDAEPPEFTGKDSKEPDNAPHTAPAA